MANIIRIKRGTNAALTALAGSNSLLVGELYLITDQSRVAIATATNAFTPLAKLSEAGGGVSASNVTYLTQGAAAVSTTVETKLRRTEVHVKDFGAVGDGVANDTTALMAFWQSAIDNAGVPHVMGKGIYLTTAAMPQISVSGVHIEGCGANIHDVGTIMTGTVIKYIGAPIIYSPLLNIASVSGAGNQRIHGIKVKGIGLNCQSLTAYGVDIRSIRDSEIELWIFNPLERAVNLEVVASLGEDRNVQRCKFSFYTRCTDPASVGAFGVVCGGDSGANISMNEFWIDSIITNASGVLAINTDNNEWAFLRVYKVPSGTATEGVSLYGGASEPVSSRGERFLFYSANVPIHAYGTNEGFAYPSTNHTAFLDTDNNTPIPSIGTGATIAYSKSTNEFGGRTFKYLSPVEVTAITVSGHATANTLSVTGDIASAGYKLGVSQHLFYDVNATTFGIRISTTGPYYNFKTTNGSDLQINNASTGDVALAYGGTETVRTGSGGTFVYNKLLTSASTTTRAGINIAPGIAPTSPSNGDMWSTTAGFYGRVNGVTVGPFGTGGGGGGGPVPAADVTVDPAAWIRIYGDTAQQAFDDIDLQLGSIDLGPSFTDAGLWARTGAGVGYGGPLGFGSHFGVFSDNLTIVNQSLSNNLFAQSPASTVKGNSAGVTGVIGDITMPTLASMLPVFGVSTKGVVPASGTPSGKFLKDDGTWAAAGGGSSAPVVTIRSATFTATGTSGQVVELCSATTDMTVNLPTAVGNTAIYNIKKTAASGKVTIDASGSQTIDGGLTAILTRQYESITLVSDNANWMII